MKNGEKTIKYIKGVHMSNQYSLREKFLQFYKNDQLLTEVEDKYDFLFGDDLLNEAVYGSVYKAPLILHKNDIMFLDQFEPPYWAAALAERYNKLYYKLLELNEARKKELKKLFNKFLPQEQREINSDPSYSNLSVFTRAHMAKHHAYDRAKQIVANKISTRDIKGEEKEVYDLSIGGGKRIQVPAFSYFTGPLGLIAILEGTPGRNDGYDLFNPRMEGDMRVTDGFNFPRKSTIEKMLIKHYNYLANGIVPPTTPLEAQQYDPAKRSTFKPIKGTGWIKDTFSKTFMIDDYAQQFENMDQRENVSTNVKRREAYERALEQFVKNVDLGRLTYANGNKMYGAKIVERAPDTESSGGSKKTVELQSDNDTMTMTVDGKRVQVPVSVLMLPHKKVTQNGVEKEVPVLLPGMPFKPVKSQEERNSYQNLLVGRDFYNIRRSSSNDPMHAPIFRRLTPIELERSKEGQDIKHAGGLKPNQNSVGVDFLSKTDPRHKDVIQYLLNNPDFDFHAFTDEVLDDWLSVGACMDQKDLCHEKTIMSLYKADLKSMIEIKVLKNLNNMYLFGHDGLNTGVLQEMMERELNRILTQDLGRGTRRKREARQAAKRQKNICRRLSTGECGLNYDVSTILEDYIDSIVVAKTKPTVSHNLKELRTKITAEINALYDVVDTIRNLYEDMTGNAEAADQYADNFIANAPLANRELFIEACNEVVAQLIKEINKRKKKPILAKYADFIASHQLKQLRDFIDKQREVRAAELATPIQQAEKPEATTIDVVDNAVNQYKAAIAVDPNMDDTALINRISISLANPDLAKKFKAAIQPLRRQKTREEKLVDAELKSITDKVNEKEFAYKELMAFFKVGNIDEKLAMLDMNQKASLQDAIKKTVALASEEGMHREVIRRIKGFEFLLRRSTKRRKA